MIEQANNVRKHLGRFLIADPGRFAGGSAVSDPFGLLAVEREHLTVPRSPQHEGSPQAAAPAERSTQPDPSGDVTGPTESSAAGRYRRPVTSTPLARRCARGWMNITTARSRRWLRISSVVTRRIPTRWRSSCAA